MDGEDSSSSASTSSSNNGNPPSREQRFFFSNDHFDLKNHLGDRGILISGIEQLNLSSDDIYTLIQLTVCIKIAISGGLMTISLGQNHMKNNQYT